ncbi:Hypp1646 [Branchiostoma lanceolatum]|uniref:Hypp1646 protein n=1 Tax=Branchiostoma lanceolatum TaxID=7740 RepID=A0A8J9ZLK3_BRALA|nr:Hypp1646 [Branchiostoma lanceolatum]
MSDTTTAPVVPVGTMRRYRCCGSCGGCGWCGGQFQWWTTKLRTRLKKNVGTKTAGVIVALLTFFLVGFGAATVLLSLECARSNPLDIWYTVVVAAGLCSTVLLLWAALRDPYMPLEEETEEELKMDRAKSTVTFVVLFLLAIACMVVDIYALVVANSCSFREDGLPSRLHTGTAFHVTRLFFVVAQVSVIGWLHMTRRWPKRTVGSAFLAAFVVLADASCWLYQVSENADIICDTSSCWSSVAPTAQPCEGSDRTTHCDFLRLKRYCTPLVGQFSLVATAAMFVLWSKARGSEHAGRESEGEPLIGRRPQAHGDLAAPGWLVAALVLFVLSVALVIVTQ